MENLKIVKRNVKKYHCIRSYIFFSEKVFFGYSIELLFFFQKYFGKRRRSYEKNYYIAFFERRSASLVIRSEISWIEVSQKWWFFSSLSLGRVENTLFFPSVPQKSIRHPPFTLSIAAVSPARLTKVKHFNSCAFRSRKLASRVASSAEEIRK